MPRTPTAPPTARSMWRRLLARAHPDRGGDHDLFIWTGALREHVVGGKADHAAPQAHAHEGRRPTPRPSPSDSPRDSSRVPYAEGFDDADDFEGLTAYALYVADGVAEPFASLLRLLEDCRAETEADPALYCQQCPGATYKPLATIAYAAELDKAERTRWYRIAEGVLLSQRHAGHILSRLEEGAA